VPTAGGLPDGLRTPGTGGHDVYWLPFVGVVLAVAVVIGALALLRLGRLKRLAAAVQDSRAGATIRQAARARTRRRRPSGRSPWCD
jgi:hypothetical protein